MFKPLSVLPVQLERMLLGRRTRLYSYNNTPQHEASASVDRQTARTAAAQTGTTATACLSHVPGATSAPTSLWDDSGVFFMQNNHKCNGFRGYHLRPSLGAAQYGKGKNKAR